MRFSPYSTEIRQFKIPPTALFEQTAKYNVRQYFCLYGISFGKSVHFIKLSKSNFYEGTMIERDEDE